MSRSNLHYFLPAWIEKTDREIEADICIYGGSSAGVIAAVATVGRGKSAVIVQPGNYLGGLSTSGLGCTDYGKQHVIGGLARQFYRDLGAFYGRAEEWMFEPHAAQSVIDRYVKEAGVPVYFRQYLEAVEMDGVLLRRIRLLGGLKVSARMFIDATYEGDLMAMAGVSYTVGRESNRRYGETINGVQIRETHQFSHTVDPYLEPGNPASGTLPFINQQDAAPVGSGDHRIQAYNFRVCMTDDPDLKVLWEKPADFDDGNYELARRWFSGAKDNYNDQLSSEGAERAPRKFDILTERTAAGYLKTDTNNHGPVSSDFIGANYGWPEAGYHERERIFQAHVSYQKGLYWFLANDDSIPARYREAYSRFGLPRDEFQETGHWPPQLYIREARRIRSDYILTEHDTQHRRQPEDPVGMGSYAMDSHNCQRIVRDGRVLNEGDVQLEPAGPYGVSYHSIIPAVGECGNLAVPVCLSASHIAYGSVRMEPVFMVLAESAAVAACLALDANSTIQEVDYQKLREVLEASGQVLQSVDFRPKVWGGDFHDKT